MNLTEIARYLGVTPQRVQQLARKPGFPAPAGMTWTRHWDPAEVEAWAEREWWDTKPWRGRPTT